MQNADGSAPVKPGGAMEPALPLRSEKKIILLLCFMAALHVFIFSAAFPFFNNVSEAMRYDLVLTYSSGRVPLECPARFFQRRQRHCFLIGPPLI